MGAQAGQTPNDLDRFPIIVTLCFASAVGALLFNTLPVFLGVLARKHGLIDQQISLLASGAMLGSALSVTAAIWWVGRYRWRVIVRYASLLAVTACIAQFFSQTAAALAVSLGILGAALGAIYVPSLTALGSAKSPVRAFALAIVTQVALSACFVFIIPSLIPMQHQKIAVTGFVTIAAVIVMLATRYFPNRCPERPAPEKLQSPKPAGSILPGSLRLVGMGAYYAGLVALWAFLDRLGASKGLGGEDVGTILSSALILGAGGAIVAGALSERLGNLMPVAVSVTLLLAAMALIDSADNLALFALSVIGLNVVWNFSLPFLYAAIAEGRAGDVMVSAIPAVQTFGGFAGAGLTAPLVVSYGYSGIIVLTAVAGLVLLALNWVSSSMQNRVTAD